MRRCLHVPAAVLAIALAARPVVAQETRVEAGSSGGPARATASGSLGAGTFGDQVASSVELGLDVAGDGYALGVGATARWLAGDGFRHQDWDDASEWAGIVRYALYRWDGGDDGDAGDGSAVSAAVGELGGVTLGHGSLMDGFAGGLDADHGRVGAQVSGAAGRVAGELVVDDVVAPRIAGARVAVRAGPSVLGASLAGDRGAPSAGASETAGGFAVDAELGAGSPDDDTRGALYADLVRLVGAGASGAHVGARGQLALSSRLLVGGRAELRAGSDRYLPGWIGPLYERDRRELASADGTIRGQLDAARAGGLAGLGTAAQLEVEVVDVASAALGYSGRAGLGDLFTARLSAPYRTRVQAALWAAASRRAGATEAMALAAELRVRLSGRLFLRGEAARLYREGESGMMEPVWMAQAALGAVLGE
jgi:hypothetical protein